MNAIAQNVHKVGTDALLLASLFEPVQPHCNHQCLSSQLPTSSSQPRQPFWELSEHTPYSTPSASQLATKVLSDPTANSMKNLSAHLGTCIILSNSP